MDKDEKRIIELEEALADMVNQFGYEGSNKNGPFICTGGLSALEGAFFALGYSDPHYTPWRCCEIEGCKEHSSSGMNTENGYKRLCSTHAKEQWEKQNG
jgi:hypothetical protein